MFHKIKDLFKRKPTWAERVSASIKTYEKSRNTDDLFDVFVYFDHLVDELGYVQLVDEIELRELNDFYRAWSFSDPHLNTIKENNMSNLNQSAHPVNEPFSLNLSPDSLPDVSLEHDSMTDEVHIKFFNVDNELVLDLWGSLNDAGSLLSGLSIIAKYRALRIGFNKAMAEEDSVGAAVLLMALKDLQHTREFSTVFENVNITTSTTESYESPKKDPEQGQGSQRDAIGFDALTDEDVETFLAKLDKMFNGE